MINETLSMGFNISSSLKSSKSSNSQTLPISASFMHFNLWSSNFYSSISYYVAFTSLYHTRAKRQILSGRSSSKLGRIPIIQADSLYRLTPKIQAGSLNTGWLLKYRLTPKIQADSYIQADSHTGWLPYRLIWWYTGWSAHGLTGWYAGWQIARPDTCFFSLFLRRELVSVSGWLVRVWEGIRRGAENAIGGTTSIIRSRRTEHLFFFDIYH